MNDFSCHTPLTMTLGEGPFWDADAQTLFWVDIVGAELHRQNMSTNEHSAVKLDEAISCVVRHVDGGFVAGMRSGIWRLDEAGNKIECLARNPENAADHRFNDGGTDPRGRLWIGTMDENMRRADAHLYLFDGAKLHCEKPNLSISNGVAFSPDGDYLYHTDTPRRVIERHPYNVETGEIGEAEDWVSLADWDVVGNPDGGAVDAQGHYWCALYAGGAVARFDSDARLVDLYKVAAPNPTMPAFGGDDLCTLFVTTARQHMPPPSLKRFPEAGSLFSMRVDQPGQRLSFFKPTAG